MTVTRIVASDKEIKICLDSPASELSVKAFLPLINANTVDKYSEAIVVASATSHDSTCIVLPRFDGGIDLALCRFEVCADGTVLSGVCYVTDTEKDYSEVCPPAPKTDKPVGTWVTALEEDIDLLGFGCMMTEINCAWLQTLTPTDDDYKHTLCGKTFYFSRKTVDMYDSLMIPCIKRNIPCLIRLINRPSYRNRGSDDTLMSAILHPDYVDTDFSEQMSAFNLRTETGFWMYCAFVDFICARYLSPSSPLRCAYVLDVGNEINAQQTWHNCGPMPCEGFMEEYAVQLRIAHLIARKYCGYSRVNISLDHCFSIPLRDDASYYYPARECLAYLLKYCKRDGNFDWGIAAHPYPENLSLCDFYNDVSATFSFDTQRITMKNMEMWQALVELDEFKLGDTSRRVVFDEQGFHTNYDDPESENKGAHAFVLAYLKMRNCKDLDWFLINRYADMPLGDEASLHLGLRYEQGYADDDHLFVIPGEYKKICYAIRDMETAAEAERKQAARDYIGADLFDSLLSPSVPDSTDYFKMLIE